MQELKCGIVLGNGQILVLASIIYMDLIKCMEKTLKVLHLANPVLLALRILTHMDSSINFRSSVHIISVCSSLSIFIYVDMYSRLLIYKLV